MVIQNKKHDTEQESFDLDLYSNFEKIDKKTFSYYNLNTDKEYIFRKPENQSEMKKKKSNIYNDLSKSILHTSNKINKVNDINQLEYKKLKST